MFFQGLAGLPWLKEVCAHRAWGGRKDERRLFGSHGAHSGDLIGGLRGQLPCVRLAGLGRPDWIAHWADWSSSNRATSYWVAQANGIAVLHCRCGCRANSTTNNCAFGLAHCHGASQSPARTSCIQQLHNPPPALMVRLVVQFGNLPHSMKYFLNA